jgi:ferrous iron transport protein A
MQTKFLVDLKPGQSGEIVKVGGSGPSRRRMIDMGLVSGTVIEVVKVAPLGDPIEFKIKGYNLSLRKSEAREIEIKEHNNVPIKHG